ncbi:secretin N-terminal domain-containing protein [Rhizobium oryzicola]|uniref:Secretin N-terminal domain-containing protein n=1 Tax=Rhizobium oryzicola TaxID=1232668 RepID=A0ABT8SXN9_9HYPH|nr:secretin N-terminal domain-containing protein [Rhizobium oryzicola]MDO1583198.1 secretin N-terminal domain-containing protein [Rhizobium oryzicola]
MKFSIASAKSDIQDNAEVTCDHSRNRPVLAWMDRRRAGSFAILMAAACWLVACTTVEDALVVDDPNAVPRLASNQAPRKGPVVDVEKLNKLGAEQTSRTFTAYVGKEKIDYPGDVATIAQDIGEVRSATKQASFEPTAEVSIDFKNATIDEVLRRLLSGALGVNYIAPDNLAGRVTFKTETPVPKARVLSVVRDILSRNNLVMRSLNGIYHIGTPEAIAALDTNAANGARGQEAQRVIQLPKGNAQEVVALAGRMLPPSVVLQASSSRNTVILQAGPTEADSAERLVRMLSNMATGQRSIAILPLGQGEPQAVARQITDFYSGSLRGSDANVTIIPLEAQRAVLVGTPDETVMENVRLLVRQLDQSVSDISALRVIPLTHLRAEEIAPQLAQSFGAASGGGNGPVADEPRRGIDQRISRSKLFPNSQAAGASADNEDGTSLAAPPPSTIIATPNGGQSASQSSGQGGAQRGGRAPANGQTSGANNGDTIQVSAPAGGGNGQADVRIVADKRNNTLLVYSNYRIFSRMRDVVAALDVPQSQAVIEATVIEVNLTNSLSQGVAFYLQGKGFNVGSGIPGNQSPRDGGVIGFSGSVGSFSVDAVLKALQQVTTLKVVSSPYLTVMNGQAARLVIGDQIPFATASQSSNNGGNVTVTREVQILDTGIVMQITPTIHADDSVTLQINQSVSTPKTSTGGDSLTPTISTRDIQSQILVQSGRTVLLGGLIQDNVGADSTQIPKVSKVPILGDLLSQKNAQSRRTELVVLITPRVSRTANEIDSITKQLQSFMVSTPQASDPAGIKRKPATSAYKQ